MRATLLAAAVMLLPAVGSAQTVEDRLRDALRHQTIDLRAAEDAEATLKAQLDQAAKQRDVLQQQVSELSAKLAATPAASPAKIPPSQAAPADDAAPLRAQNHALQEQLRAMQSALVQAQGSYQQAVGAARGRDAEGQQAAAAAKSAEGRIGACETENTALTGVANDILHLYETAGFRHTVIASYEPLLGLKKVELQNIVQDYEDKIRDHTYLPTAGAAR